MTKDTFEDICFRLQSSIEAADAASDAAREAAEECQGVLSLLRKPEVEAMFSVAKCVADERAQARIKVEEVARLLP